jgi:type I restriction enzyme S subunit
MKEDWKLITLGEACEKGSSNVSQNQLTEETGDYPIYGASGFIKNVSFYHHKKPYLSIVKDGSGVGRVTKMDAFTSVIGTQQYIIPKEDIDLNYLYYSLISIDFKKYIAGAAIPHIYFKDYKNEPFLWMPLSEQLRIVSILDSCFAAIDKAKANAEKNLQNTRELFESYLQGVFEGGDWDTKPLSQVCEISSKLIDPRKPEYYNYIHVGAGNIESKTGKLNDLKTAKEENLISGKFLFDDSMVLYSKIRPYLMKVVKCDFEGLCSADIYPLKPINNLITKDYLYLLLLTNDFTEYAILGSQRAGMPKVNREHLFSYNCRLPSIKQQQIIVRQLDALRAETQKLEAVYRQKLADLEELKKSLLEKAFRGELTGEKFTTK